MANEPPDEGQAHARGIHQDEPQQAGAVLEEPPPNPLGGRTLVVDARDRAAYERPSAALKDAEVTDQIFIRPGVYEDKIFMVERPFRLIGAGRDCVQVFSRRGGPLYLQRVSGGYISGITFRYVGSDQNSAINILDSTCTVTHCRATEGLLSGVVLYGPQCRPSLIENEVCRNRESGIFSFAGRVPTLPTTFATRTITLGSRSGTRTLCPTSSAIPVGTTC